ncbi:MAG: hypothetical protein U0354_15390 [Candidatus Sericytochromatia bacterium]
MENNEITIKTKEVFELLTKIINKENNLTSEDFYESTILIIYKTITSLKNYLDNTKNYSNWGKTYLEIQIPINLEGKNNIFNIKENDIQNNDSKITEISEKIVNQFFNNKYLFALRLLSHDQINLITHNKKLLLPTPFVSAIKTISLFDKKKRSQKSIMKDLVKSEVFQINISKDEKENITFFIDFNSFNIDKNFKNFYFSIYTGLDFTGLKVDDLTKESKEQIWQDLFNKINKMSDKNLEKELIKLPDFEFNPIDKKTNLVRVSLHTENLKFGKKPDSSNNIVENEDNKELLIEHQIEAVGIDNTQAQNQALFAIQKLLHETNYKGNLEESGDIESPYFRFKGYMPAMKFTPAQYLDAYGVPKYETSRGKIEYSGEARKQAMDSLKEIALKMHLLIYKKISWVKNDKGKYEEKIDRIETITPLVRITQGWQNLSRKEDSMLDINETNNSIDEKLKFISLEPCPTLVDQIDSYFVLKPANYYQEIKLIETHASKYVYLFIDYLLAEIAKRDIATRNKKTSNKINWIIRQDYEALAYTLRMNSYIKNKKIKDIKKALDKCFDVAKKLRYITEYKLISNENSNEIYEIILNPDKFKRVKEIEAERKTMDQLKLPILDL